MAFRLVCFYASAQNQLQLTKKFPAFQSDVNDTNEKENLNPVERNDHDVDCTICSTVHFCLYYIIKYFNRKINTLQLMRKQYVVRLHIFLFEWAFSSCRSIWIYSSTLASPFKYFFHRSNAADCLRTFHFDFEFALKLQITFCAEGSAFAFVCLFNSMRKECCTNRHDMTAKRRKFFEAEGDMERDILIRFSPSRFCSKFPETFQQREPGTKGHWKAEG